MTQRAEHTVEVNAEAYKAICTECMKLQCRGRDVRPLEWWTFGPLDGPLRFFLKYVELGPADPEAYVIFPVPGGVDETSF